MQKLQFQLQLKIPPPFRHRLRTSPASAWIGHGKAQSCAGSAEEQDAGRFCAVGRDAVLLLLLLHWEVQPHCTQRLPQAAANPQTSWVSAAHFYYCSVLQVTQTLEKKNGVDFLFHSLFIAFSVLQKRKRILWKQMFLIWGVSKLLQEVVAKSISHFCLPGKSSISSCLFKL